MAKTKSKPKSKSKPRYRDHGVMSMLFQRNITDLSDAELKRAFSECVAPDVCFRRTKRMIEQGLTHHELFKTKWWKKKEYTGD